MPLINGHSKGFDLPITEGGQGVSGGQRQLIGLTRLILARPQVWLLDEPTASMDDATEIRTVQILSQIIQPDQTLILVTHKPAMLALVGRVIVMGSDGIVLDGLRDAVLTALQEKHGKKETSSRQPNPTSSSDEKDQSVKQALSPMTITMGGRKYETT
jgi:ATP-binding cassette subfamily C protein LapB